MAQEPTGSGQPPPGPTRKRLRRSANEKVLFGVAGGIAEYLDVDPILIRVGFVVLAFAGASGILVYIILAILMPGPDETSAGDGIAMRGSPQQVIGIVVVAVGVILLLVNLGVMSRFPWHIVWPVAIIAVGVAVLFTRTRSSN